MIDIIIPAYNAHDTIENAINSIMIQTIKKSIHVYIIDDCSDKNYNKEVKKYKKSLNITELKTPQNMGPGGARQFGIDNSQSEYLMFLDADDLLYDCFSVEKLYNFISSNNYNAVCSRFIEERDNGTINHDANITWMHGKMYRREFLLKNNIRFNTEYRGANEDTGFNHLVYLVDKMPYLDEPTYVWKNIVTSITRRNNKEYSFSGLEGYIHNTCYAVKEALKKDADKKKVSTLMCKIAYFTYLKYLMNSNNPKVDLILEWSKELEELYNQTKDSLTYEELKKIVGEQFDSQRGSLDMVVILNHELTFNKFLERIKEI